MNSDHIYDFCQHVRKNTNQDDFIFGLITDTHFEEKEELDGYGANSLSHIRSFAQAGKSCEAQFLIHAGDMSNGNRPKKQSCREVSLSAEAMHSSGLPALFVIGNHDDNTYYCRESLVPLDDAISGTDWQNLVYPNGLPTEMVSANKVSNCYYIDFPKYKIRLLVLNTIDLPLETKADGTLKYYMINDHGFSKNQLEFVAHNALDLSELSDSQNWSVLICSHMSFDFLPNGAAMNKILTAFQNGKKCKTGPEDVKECPFFFDRHSCFPSSPDPTDLVHYIEADFSNQGPREIIAHLYGHEHLDEVRTAHGFTEITLLASLCYQNEPDAPIRKFGTSSEYAWNMISIDQISRKIKVFRSGAGKDFSVTY